VQLIWSLDAATWGWFAVAVAVGYGVIGGALQRRAPDLGSAHLLAAALLLPLGTAAALSGDRLYLALAAQGALLHLLSRRLDVQGTRLVGHLLFAVGALWFIVRVDAAGVAGTWRALTDLLVIAAALVASTQIASPSAVRIYRFSVHLALLAWFWRELSILPGGAAYVSIAWSAYGLALLVGGLWMRIEIVQKTALATLVVMVAKLFIVDLAALEALWRILLFLGVGGVFLVISYLLQGLWAERSRVAGQ